MILLVVSGLIWFSMEKSYAHEFLFSFGSEGSEDGEFNQPFGIAFDSIGNIYVADNFNNRIQKFNSTGYFLDTWGSKGTGDGEFLQVYGMAIDSMDNLYVIDGGSNDRIQKFTSAGNFEMEWSVMIPGDDFFLNPLDIAIDSKDNIYVLENANSRIQVFDTDGNPITVWGVEGSNDGELQNPIGIAIDSSDGVYILEFGNKRVQKFDESGSFITKWGAAGLEESRFSHPSGVAIDSMDNVYILDSDKIQKFENNGSLIYYWDYDEEENYLFDKANHLTVDSSDRIFVADSGNNRISVFSQNEIKDPGFHYDAKSFGDSPVLPQGLMDTFSEQDNSFDEFTKITDLSLHVTPSSAPVKIGQVTSTVINLKQRGDNLGEVFLKCEADDVICEIDPPNVKMRQAGLVKLRVITNNETSLGHKLISIAAYGGGAEATTAFGTTVEPPPKNPPTSRISPIPPTDGNKIVFLNGTDSFDEDGEIKKYHWKFGDMTTDQGSQVTHTYENPGTYTVMLTVTDNDGESNQSERDIKISPAFDPLLIIMLGVIIMMGALAALVIITRKRDGGKTEKINIPKPKESRLK